MALEKMYTQEEAAAWLQISPRTLENWRRKPTADTPQFVRIGEGKNSVIRYPEGELLRFQKRRTQK